ncbi:MAG: PilT/PilU family type 4a pilus ATPase [Acetatifactor sp.]|nr:PilT/PilU family type 4a pilus ATPase [Acetatifactor sp.]
MPGIDEILQEARSAGASDVHLASGVSPRMRIGGRLAVMDHARLQPADTLDILVSVMPEVHRLRLEEKGECDFSLSLPGCGRCRVNVYKQRGSVALAFHLVDNRVPSLEELGMPASVIGLCEREQGLVLVTGPTGNGKSTTLAAMVDRINDSREAHIITLEDPVEYLHQHKKSLVTQREIGLDSENYVSGLRAALREDPDVILVGELCDPETVSMAVQAAETGHLVLSAMHSVGTADTVDRLIGAFPLYQQQQMRARLANVLEAVVAQQMLPVLNEDRRTAVFEALLVDDQVRSLIREGKTYQLPQVIKAGGQQGMAAMEEAVEKLFLDGRISEETRTRFIRSYSAIQ